MPLFQELDLTTFSGGQITGIVPGSVADEIGLQPGDELLAINDQTVEDVIDVQFYGAEESLELLVRRGEEYFLFEAEREYQQELGLEFSHPTFDTDIRICKNLCEFCFVLQMAPKFRRTLYIKDDDYRYSFLFGHFVTLTNLSEHDWWRIENMRLSPLYVSVHVTDLEARRNFLRFKDAPDIIEQLKWLAERDIEVHTQLVVVPEVNDGPLMERSIAELAELWPAVKSISVVPVGLTRHHKYKMRTHTKAEAEAILDYVESLHPIYLEKFGVRFAYPTDEWYLITDREVPAMDSYDGQQLHENGLGLVRRFLDEWASVKSEIKSYDGTPAEKSGFTLVTGTMFAPLLNDAAVEFSSMTGIDLQVKPIINQRLGETIRAAGLLMGEDIVNQLKSDGHGDFVILPRVTFDHPDTISLDNLSPQEIANELGCSIGLADTMGDVWDMVIGEATLVFRPEAGQPSQNSKPGLPEAG